MLVKAYIYNVVSFVDYSSTFASVSVNGHDKTYPSFILINIFLVF